eukprot:Skav223846  [mRNA]  locus=scaffold2304:326841:335459:+ [translate_table: standard]
MCSGVLLIPSTNEIRSRFKIPAQDKRELVETLSKEKEEVEARLEARQRARPTDARREAENRRDAPNVEASLQQSTAGPDTADEPSNSSIEDWQLAPQAEMERELQELREADELSQADRERQSVLMELQAAATVTQDLKKELVGLEGLRDSGDTWKGQAAGCRLGHGESGHRAEGSGGVDKELGISGIDDIEDSEKVPRLVNMNPDKSLEARLSAGLLAALLAFWGSPRTHDGNAFEECILFRSQW